MWGNICKYFLISAIISEWAFLCTISNYLCCLSSVFNISIIIFVVVNQENKCIHLEKAKTTMAIRDLNYKSKKKKKNTHNQITLIQYLLLLLSPFSRKKSKKINKKSCHTKKVNNNYFPVFWNAFRQRNSFVRFDTVLTGHGKYSR